jgi:hypothetical protein
MKNKKRQLKRKKSTDPSLIFNFDLSFFIFHFYFLTYLSCNFATVSFSSSEN